MRIVTAAVLLVLTACASSSDAATEEVEREEANAAAVRELYDSFARGDVPSVVAGLDSQVEWIEAAGAPITGTFHGRDAVMNEVFVKLGTEWEGFKAEPSELVADGDKVVAIGTYSGKYNQTGKSFEAAFAHVWTVEDGRITRFRQIADTEMMQRALRTP